MDEWDLDIITIAATILGKLDPRLASVSIAKPSLPLTKEAHLKLDPVSFLKIIKSLVPEQLLQDHLRNNEMHLKRG